MRSGTARPRSSGFVIDQFWCEHFQPDEGMPDDDDHDPDEGPDEMFRFIKVMK